MKGGDETCALTPTRSGPVAQAITKGQGNAMAKSDRGTQGNYRVSTGDQVQLCEFTIKLSASGSKIWMLRCLTAITPSSENLEKVRLTVSSLSPK